MKLSEAIETIKKFNNKFKFSCELEKAIDTVVSALEKPLPSDEQIEQYALENILDGVGIQSMINTKAWIAGARWIRYLIQRRREK